MAEKNRIELVGAKELSKQLKEFGPKVSKRAANTGIRKAAMQVRREFKAAAPRGKTGNLRRSIKMKYSPRSGRAWVGLRDRFYYKTLEFDSARGRPLYPFMEKAWNKIRKNVAQMMITETRKALYEEAGKEFIRSKARNRRRR